MKIKDWEILVRQQSTDWKAERERIDLAAVVTGFLGPGTRRQGRLWWRCPFHDERNGSFFVKLGTRYWRCYGCGASGDAVDLVMKLEGLPFPEAIARLAGVPLASTERQAPGPKRGASPLPPGQDKTQNPRDSGFCPGPSGLSPGAAAELVEASADRLWTDERAAALAHLIGPKRGLTAETIRAARLG